MNYIYSQSKNNNEGANKFEVTKTQIDRLHRKGVERFQKLHVIKSKQLLNPVIFDVCTKYVSSAVVSYICCYTVTYQMEPLNCIKFFKS